MIRARQVLDGVRHMPRSIPSPTSAPRLPHASQMNFGSMFDNRTSSDHRSSLIAEQCEP